MKFPPPFFPSLPFSSPSKEVFSTYKNNNPAFATARPHPADIVEAASLAVSGTLLQPHCCHERVVSLSHCVGRSSAPCNLLPPRFHPTSSHFLRQTEQSTARRSPVHSMSCNTHLLALSTLLHLLPFLPLLLLSFSLPSFSLPSSSPPSSPPSPFSLQCQRHLTVLPNGSRAGFFIGDGAGVGKGRQVRKDEGAVVRWSEEGGGRESGKEMEGEGKGE